MPKKRELPVQEVVEKYNNGFSSKKLAVEYNCSVSHIAKTLKIAGVKLRQIGYSARKYDINLYYFDSIDTEDKAYWLGIFLTDGSTSSRRIRLSFKQSDEEHLYKFKRDIGSNHPITYQCKDIYTQACIDVTNKYMHNALVNKGIISNNKRVHQLNNFERDYWRGAIDGDGTLSRDRKVISLCGTRETCILFKKFCRKHVKTKSKVAKVKDKNLWTFGLHGDVAFKIVEVLYADSKVYLDRKYQIFLDWERWYKQFLEESPSIVNETKDYKFSVLRCKMKHKSEYKFINGEYVISINKELSKLNSMRCLFKELRIIESLQ